MMRQELRGRGARALANRTQTWVWRSPAVAVLLVAMGVPPDVAPDVARHWQPRPPACAPVSDRDVVPAQSTIDTGQYTLTLVATGGPSAGASSRGGLWLGVLPAAGDSVPRPRASPRTLREQPGVPLYGTTDADLSGVSAPLPHGDTSVAPKPYASNPKRPGVIARYRIDSTNMVGIWRLYIATVANDQTLCHPGTRCWDNGPAEGPGIVLDVHKVDATGFAGTWRPVAPDQVRGYFCAAPVRYYSRFKTRNLPQAPATH